MPKTIAPEHFEIDAAFDHIRNELQKLDEELGPPATHLPPSYRDPHS